MSDTSPEPPSSAAAARGTGSPTAPWWLSRMVVASVVLAGFVALAVADARGVAGAPPAWWLLPVAVVLAVGGTDELATLFRRRDLSLPVWLLRPAAVAIVLSAAFGSQAVIGRLPGAADGPVANLAALGWPAITCAVAMMAVFAFEIMRYRAHGGALERVAAACLILVFVGLPLSFIVLLRLLCVENLGPEQRGAGHLGIVPLASLVAVVKAGDIAAYVVGSLVGRRRMAPLLSPGKTWEGAAASLVASTAVACAVPELAGRGLPSQPWAGWACYGLAVGVAGMLGDLAESLLKRETGTKDSGSSLGGMGGVLDLIDSLLFAAPVAWLLWVLGR